jgi:hypothetical protein
MNQICFPIERTDNQRSPPSLIEVVFSKLSKWFLEPKSSSVRSPNGFEVESASYFKADWLRSENGAVGSFQA